jgi:hypothetical protein
MRYTKRKRGGDPNVSSLQNQLNNVQEEINNIKQQLAQLQTTESPSMETMMPSSDMSSSDMSSSDMSSSDMMSINAMPSTIPSLSSEPESVASMSLMDQSISLTGYSGTVGDLCNKMKVKISQLNKPSNRGKYSNKANEYNNILMQIKTQATSVDDVKQLVQYVSFKNNNLMGGKTMKRRKTASKRR